MTRASCTRKQTSAARSRPACPAYSRSATCARDRSSALPPPSARAPRWWPHFTPSSATPATQPGSPPTPGDHDVRRVLDYAALHHDIDLVGHLFGEPYILLNQ